MKLSETINNKHIEIEDSEKPVGCFSMHMANWSEQATELERRIKELEAERREGAG